MQSTDNIMDDYAWKEEVTKLLLTVFDGRARFSHLRKMLYRRNLVDDNGIRLVLERLSDSSRFLLYVKNGKVTCVSVCRKDAIICRDIREPSCETCGNENCLKYHVCEFFIIGNCTNSIPCPFGHDIESDANKMVSYRLGLSSFSAEEILAIVLRSHPVVCVKYNTRGCLDDECPDLHVCDFFILQKCTAGDTCLREHNLQRQWHNKWVLDVFDVRHLADEEMRKRILVNDSRTESGLRSPAITSLNVISSSTVTSSASLPPEYTNDYISEVFSFLLKRFGGRTTLHWFMAKRRARLGLFFLNEVVQWFKDNSDRFLLFEQERFVYYVSVYNSGATLCSVYNSSDETRHGPSCIRFHLCRNFIAGTCTNASQCSLSHSFSLGPNAQICKDLNLCQFTDDEIRQLVLCSSPAVCVPHNTYACTRRGCPDLHVCSKYIVDLCTGGNACTLGHAIKDSEHNIWVLNVFRMQSLEETILRNLVIVKGGTTLALPPTATAPHEGSDRTVDNAVTIYQDPVLFAILATDVDPDTYEYLCEEYTWTGTCSSIPDCPRYHSRDRAPYLWMILCGGRWYTFSKHDSLHFERSFCFCSTNLAVKISVGSHRPLLFNVNLNSMEAFVEGLVECVKVVRLSTPSYVMAAPPTPPTFYTQWLWLWKRRCGSFTALQPRTLQYTLEEKYLKGLYRYVSTIEDYLMIIDTRMWTVIMSRVYTGDVDAEQLFRRPFLVIADRPGPPAMSSFLLDKTPPPLLHQVPTHWAAVDRFRDFELFELHSNDPEYVNVKRLFFSTMDVDEYKINHIFRLQNPALWDRYCSARRAMTPLGQRPEDVDERLLFHGTPTIEAAWGICANSFDFRRSGEFGGAVYGKGSYFSTTAAYSHTFTNTNMNVRFSELMSRNFQRFMFLGRVLVGQYTLGDPSYTKPPERDGLKMYDSCVNDVSNPTTFVIFDLAQSYPEYLIQYCDKRDV